MRYLYLILIITLNFSCSTNNEVVEKQEQKKNNHIEKGDILITKLQAYELSSHKIFQERLNKISDEFIKKQSENFVDNETGFFKLWSEAFNYFGSDIKKNEKWKSRIEKYFKSTDYITFITEQENNYVATINEQRKELLGELHLNKNKLNLPKLNTSILKNSNNIDKVIKKVNNLVLLEVIPEIIERTIIPLLVWLIVAILGVTYKKTIGVILFVLLLAFSIWQNIKYSNELENDIYNKFKLENNSHLNILAILNQNTDIYYSKIKMKLK